MRSYIILVAMWLAVFYLAANAVCAIKDLQYWLFASWTATRGVNRQDDPWKNGDIRALGTFFAAAAILWGYLAVKFTILVFR